MNDPLVVIYSQCGVYTLYTEPDVRMVIQPFFLATGSTERDEIIMKHVSDIKTPFRCMIVPCGFDHIDYRIRLQHMFKNDVTFVDYVGNHDFYATDDKAVLMTRRVNRFIESYTQ